MEKINYKEMDNIANEQLSIPKDCISINRQSLSQYSSVYYKEPGNDGSALIVCKDLSYLKASSIIPVDMHIKAFLKGLRTKTS